MNGSFSARRIFGKKNKDFAFFTQQVSRISKLFQIQANHLNPKNQLDLSERAHINLKMRRTLKETLYKSQSCRSFGTLQWSLPCENVITSFFFSNSVTFHIKMFRRIKIYCYFLHTSKIFIGITLASVSKEVLSNDRLPQW